MFVFPADLLLGDEERFEKITLQANREIDITDWRENYYRIAESQFNRWNAKSQNPKQLQSVDLFINSVLEKKFKRKKAAFVDKYGENEPWSKEILAFHGTPFDNPELIMKENFRTDKVKRTAHGFGIYFSEYPEVSLGYGKHLILARVVPGKQGEAAACPNRDNCEDHDSHLVQPNEQKYSQQVVIRDVDQILPMFILHVV